MIECKNYECILNSKDGICLCGSNNDGKCDCNGAEEDE